MTVRKLWVYGLLVLVVALGVSLLVVQLVVAERLEDTVYQVKLDVATQQTTIASLSEVMARGGVDEVTNSVIKDCAADERTRFDMLLGRLGDGLSRPELTELSRLFDRCASYYARQKAVMAARFEREVEVYESYLNRLPTLLPGVSLDEYAAPVWQELAQYERAQADLFETLVRLQGEIIDILEAGKTAGDPAIARLLDTVRETQEMQVYNVAKMNELRAQLPSTI